jgi:MoaD family protein
MITIEVKFMSIARQRAGVSAIKFASSEGQRLRDVLEAIVGRYRIEDIILSETGEVRAWARVLVNGRSHDFVGGLDVQLRDGDSVALIYPYADNF